MAVRQKSESQEERSCANGTAPSQHSATQPHAKNSAEEQQNSLKSTNAARHGNPRRKDLPKPNKKRKAESNSAGMNSLCAIFRGALQHVWQMGQPDAVKIAIDCTLIAIAAGWTWLVAYSQVRNPGSPLPFMAAVLSARLFIYLPLRLYRHSWLHVSRHEVLWLAFSALLGPFAIAAAFAILPDPYTLSALVRPHLILATEPALYLLMLCLARLAARSLYSSGQSNEHNNRLIIVGAGSAGRALGYQIQEMSEDYHVVGFVDDDPRLQNRRIRGIRVLGTCADLPDLAENCHASEIVIAIASLKPERLREIIAYCSQTGLPVRILPPLRQLIGGRANLGALREVRMEDLLPRPEVKLDREALASYLKDRVVLVTGGGGSIGGELCRQVLAAGSKRLLVLGRGENSVFEMVQELSEIKKDRGLAAEIVPIICDVRDRVALTDIFERFEPQVVFHAAAHKHVPLMEQYPCEAVKNNVLGTFNVVQLSVLQQVERFVMVSTDKAVDPSSVMGATKRIGEMIVKAYAAESGLNMVSVRFGNVLGSRGSVVPTMRRQIQRGLPVTITDPDMVRYFMTIPEAVQLILQAGSIGGSGEVFLLDMGHPVRILDLAYDLIRLSGLVPDHDIPISIVGRRPGEKMKEEILSSAEVKVATRKGPFFIASSSHVELEKLLPKIDHLQSTGRTGDGQSTLRLIQELVPDFNSEQIAGQKSEPIVDTPGQERQQSIQQENAVEHSEANGNGPTREVLLKASSV